MSLKNGWTGGQYSIFRALLGLYLVVHFVELLPWGAEVFSSEGVLPDGDASPLLDLFPNVLRWWDSPAAVTTLLVAGAVSSFLFALGWFDRVAAIVVWWLLASLFGRNPLIANPSLPYVGWMLLAHAFLAPAPYGSFTARGRSDPGGGWSFSERIFLFAWILMAVGYSYSGCTKLMSASWVDGTAMARVLENPLARPTFLREWMLALPEGLLKVATWGALAAELLFAPLALIRRVRPFVWLAMLLMHLGLMSLIDFADLSLGMVFLHWFTFDPSWVRPRAADAVEHLFYDGECGLCHRFVRFVLAEDRGGRAFRFAPLFGPTYDELIDAPRGALPDSLVVRRADGARLVRSEAALHVLSRLGGLWRVIALAARPIPAGLRDRVYDGVARVRKRIFAKPSGACPLVPPELGRRFDP